MSAPHDDEPAFVPGHRLSRALFDVVRPALARELPRLRYGAALIGNGSDVLGFDTVRSVDHDWGPRLQLVLAEEARASLADHVLDVVEAVLPSSVLGVPLDLLGASDTPDGELVQHNTAGRRRPHGVTVTSVPRLQDALLGTAAAPSTWDAARWASLPSQGLLELTAGPVHHDDLGELAASREQWAWYPDDVWRWALAGRWQRIAQLEAFIGRAGEVGDDLGSRVIAALIARDAMRLALLQQRVYPAYAKWLGTQFARHERGRTAVSDPLARAVAAADWRDRQHAVVTALKELGRRQDVLGLSAVVASEPSDFFSRPFTVLWGDRYVDALRSAIGDPQLRAIPTAIGTVDEVTDSTLVASWHDTRARIDGLWRV